MKKMMPLFLLLISLDSFAQIYFGAGASMYVKNELLFVRQDINLQANAKLYLRNQAQLLQGTTSTSSNKGSGILSVFQEGTSDNFDYNYWCSPIGIASSAVGNENFGITMLYSPSSATGSVGAIALPQDSRDGIASPLSIASRWIYKLTNANSYSQWGYIGATTTLAPGEGFTMKGTSGIDAIDAEGNGIKNNPGGHGAQRYDFRGKPNDGNITVTLGTNNATLTGNPYPSALHLNAFLLDPDNTAGTGIAYFWEQDKTVNSHFIADYKGGYGSYSPISLVSNGVYVAATFNSYNGDGSLNTVGTSSGAMIQRKYSPIGQGFLLNGAANGMVTLKNSHRVFYKEGNPLTQFERPSKKKSISKNPIAEASYFKLNIILNNQFTRQLALVFSTEATDGVDFGMDAVSMDNNLPNDTYFFLENKNYVIQGVNFDQTKKIPLGVKTTAAISIKFYIPEVTNFDPAQAIYLYDNLDNSYHDIKKGTYEVAVAKGTFNERFKITFSKEQNLKTEESIIANLMVSQNNTDQILTVSNGDEVELESIILYDVLGKVILSKKKPEANAYYYFPTSALSSGIYIVKLITTENLNITKKVIISNDTK